VSAQEPQKSPRGDERRSRLLELGLELFGTRSYADISIDDIAAAARISRGLLYHYFSSKRGFYVESIRFAADQLLERVRSDPSKAPADRLREGLANYLAYVENFGTAYTTLLRGGLGFDPTVAEIVERTREAIVEEMLAELGVSGALPLFRAAVRAWIGMVETASMDWLASRQPARDDLVELLVASLTAALEVAARRTHGPAADWPPTPR